jgi:hypothetical protein
MASMTIAEMRAQARAVVDIDATDISDTVLNNIIGQGFNSIVYSEKRWPFYDVATTFSTSDGTKDYTLATVGASVTQGLRDVVAVRNDDHVIQYIGSDDADSNYPLNVASSGQPWEWSFWNETIRFYPTPASVKTIYVRGIRNATDFGAGSADSATPDTPDPFHSVLVTYAIAKCYLQQEDPTMADQYQRDYMIELDNVARRYSDTPSPQPLVGNSRRSTRYLAGMGRLRYANTGGVEW